MLEYLSDDSSYSSRIKYNLLNSMVFKDSVVALKPNKESFYDYFLLHVTSNGVIKSDGTSYDTDGHKYPKDTTIITGYYYEYVKTTRKGLEYKAKQLETTVPAASVLYTGIDLHTGKGGFLLTTEDHEDIMCSISSF